MTETTRPTECNAATVYLAFELGSSKWTLAFGLSVGQRPRIRTIVAGDLEALQRESPARVIGLASPGPRRCEVATKPDAMPSGCIGGWSRTASPTWWWIRRASQ